jgi:phage shock protein PspC (stress-responsive transcriptional regulator)
MSEHITHTPIVKRLERTPSDKKIAGVAGGLGRYFDLNPNVFRLGFVILTILGGSGVLVYLAAVLVMPVEGEDQSIAGRALSQRRERPAALVGIGLVAVAIALPSQMALRSHGASTSASNRPCSRSATNARVSPSSTVKINAAQSRPSAA